MMIACHAFTNTQILNLANAKINLYAEDQADLYVYMGTSISSVLINAVRSANVFENVYCIDPLMINTRKIPIIGRIPKVRYLGMKWAYLNAYKQLLDHLNGCKTYDRAITAFFHAENVYLLHFWSKGVKNFKISFIEEGTGGYCLTPKQMYYFTLFIGGSIRSRIRMLLTEKGLRKQFSKKVDSMLLYSPESCRPAR